ncbi:MAG: N-acetylmuramoyl-L-alanine amidase [Muribaculaceae bacterium]
MKNIFNIIRRGAITLALVSSTLMTGGAAGKAKWGDFKLFLDPGHATRENRGLYGYSEAEKVLRVALSMREYLKEYTDITDEQIKMCRETDADYIGLDERSDMANAWGADFYYSIHSDSSSPVNATLFLFGGWKSGGVEIEKTPNGGKAFGEILDPNLTGVMRITSRGVWYDRSFYEKGVETHENQYPYLSVNRRTNMASLLSEGGFHTNPDQQPRNMNESYKRLEGYAGFRSMLKYRGIENPVQTMLTGIVSNSENGVPANGVTVTVDGKKVITDTYESLFNKYTSNPNLIHNGFFLFEKLEPGKEYEVTFTSPEYTAVTKKVTIVSNPAGLAADNVTWCDVKMTSTSPAKIDATSVADPTAVSLLEDIVLTFSRNMDKASVEKAFSISNSGKVTLSWDNDFTLRINISKLLEEYGYDITIDGSIAKNSQTGQFFDGDGDGKEGGNYVLSITTLPPDVTPATVKSTTPSKDATMEYTYRPVIRIEYNEPINWNDDKPAVANLITVKDASGKVYDGVLRHELISKASVFHYFFKEDLPLDKCFIVNVAGGLPDMAGNLAEPYEWKFLSEYRPTLSSKAVDPMNIASNGWYSPHGSGSSAGWTTEAENTLDQSSATSSLANPTCYIQNYAFDKNFVEAYWQIRIYKRPDIIYPDIDGILQVYLCGDGSNNGFGHGVRANTYGGGVKYQVPRPITFRGWNIMSWQMNDGKYVDLSGADELTKKWSYDSFFMKHENIAEGETVLNEQTGEYEPVPQQAWSGTLKYDELKYVKYDNTAVQHAKLNDILGVQDVETSDNSIIIVKYDASVIISAQANITSVSIFNVAGDQIESKIPKSNSITIATDGLSKGMYIVKVITDNGEKTQKVIL